MMFLAEAATGAPTGAQWSGFYIVLSILLGIGANVAVIAGMFRRQNRRIEPQPLQIELAREFTSMADFKQHLDRNAREHENIFSKIGGVERGFVQKLDDKFSEMQSKQEDGREKLHTRMNEIFGELREMKGEMKRRRLP